MAKKLYWQDTAGVALISKVLAEGQVVVGTSDTVMGLLAAPIPQGVQSLNKIKGRQNKPYILLLDSLEQARKYVDENSLLQIENIAKVCWPGPVTLIVRVCDTLDAQVCSPDGTIAIRIPDHSYLRQLAKIMGGVFSTSANLSGKPVPLSIDEIDPEIINHASYVVDDRDRLDKEIPAKASTIIDCTQDPWRVIREGSFAIDKLQAIPGLRLEQ